MAVPVRFGLRMSGGANGVNDLNRVRKLQFDLAQPLLEVDAFADFEEWPRLQQINHAFDRLFTFALCRLDYRFWIKGSSILEGLELIASQNSFLFGLCSPSLLRLARHFQSRQVKPFDGAHYKSNFASGTDIARHNITTARLAHGFYQLLAEKRGHKRSIKRARLSKSNGLGFASAYRGSILPLSGSRGVVTAHAVPSAPDAHRRR